MKNQLSQSGLSRRQFLTRTTGAVTLPILLNGIPLKAFDGPVLGELFNTQSEADRVLVLVQLSGGNDGLNTVIPLDQYSTYNSLRSNIAIPENQVLSLSSGAGLHPSMGGLKELYTNNLVGIIQGVTYPNPNLSHFRSSDIWMSGSSSDVNWSTGWIGRYLNNQFPGYPEGYPSATMPDPIAIQMTAVVGLTLIGVSGQSMGMALQDPETFYNLVNGTDVPTGDLPDTEYAAGNVEFVRDVQSKSLEYSGVINTAADKAQNIAPYPADNDLAEQLKIVARLIAGGLKTRVYVVQQKGYDTHSGQTVEGAPTTGDHATLLQQLSDALLAFQNDLAALKIDDRVVTMSFSEFGRRPTSNLSYGTDHGTAAPMFVLGTPVQNGITGHSPDLKDLDNGNLKMQFDFRQVYASVLSQWFGADPELIKSILGEEFSQVKVIKGSNTSVQSDEVASGVRFMPVAPNPVRGEARIQYTLTTETSVKIEVFDNLGFHVQTLVNEHQGPNQYTIPLSSTGLPSGTYMVQLLANGLRLVQPMVVVR